MSPRGHAGALGRAQLVGKCDAPEAYGLLRTAAEPEDSLGTCALDPRIAVLDWSRWSVVALESGVPRVRGDTVVAETVYTPACRTGNPEPQPWEYEEFHAKDPTYRAPASYYVVPVAVQSVRQSRRTRRKRCPRFRKHDPPPM